MCGLPDRGVVHMEVAADRPDDHFARVQPDPNLHGHPVGALDLVAVSGHALQHPERRIARPDGVILVGQRGAEEGHDPVAHDLVHGPLVAVDGLHHAFQDRVEEFPRLLGVPVGQELHRPLEVSEEDRDLLALAFEGPLRGEDLLGEMPGGVRLGRGEAGRRGG